MFWLKKLVSAWLMPLSLVLELGGLGLILLCGRRRRAGAILVALSFFLLLAAGNTWVSRRLIDPLEGAYPPAPAVGVSDALPPALAACRRIVVLGSGNGDHPDLSALLQLSSDGLARLTEAVRLSRLLPRAPLLFSGPTFVAGRPTNARIMAEAAAILGVDPHRITLLEDARDTEQEAARLKALLGDEDFALVTSAWHMPRAMALCRKLGLHAHPCPTAYLDRSRPGFDWSDLTWNTEALQRTTAAVHERLGLWWEWLRGRI